MSPWSFSSIRVFQQSRYDYRRHCRTYSSFSFTYAITLRYMLQTRFPLILRLNHHIKYLSPSNSVPSLLTQCEVFVLVPHP
ncbi:hypothetical protein BDR04DRAFT_1233799 [Suillus decipiens]|nr:hypothetical protein BDR04DRAFT_1233799 [Suillus decipiens]